jgi:SOS-response transcriptional repressor LexA
MIIRGRSLSPASSPAGLRLLSLRGLPAPATPPELISGGIIVHTAQIVIQDTVPVKLLDQQVATGRGREAEDYPETHSFQVPRSLIAPYRPDKLLAVHVSGDSMIEKKSMTAIL